MSKYFKMKHLMIILEMVLLFTLCSGICRDENNVIHCKNLPLTALRAGEFPLKNTYTVELSLNYCGVKNLESSPFIDMSDLEVLDLSHNSISQLHSSAFSGLVNLKILNLSNNDLQSLEEDDLFRDLGRLQKVDFSFNNIMYLKGRIFVSLTSIKEINLLNNPLFCGSETRGLNTWSISRETVIFGPCTSVIEKLTKRYRRSVKLFREEENNEITESACHEGVHLPIWLLIIIIISCKISVLIAVFLIIRFKLYKSLPFYTRDEKQMYGSANPMYEDIKPVPRLNNHLSMLPGLPKRPNDKSKNKGSPAMPSGLHQIEVADDGYLKPREVSDGKIQASIRNIPDDKVAKVYDEIRIPEDKTYLDICENPEESCQRNI